MATAKRGLLLLNLGTPDSPEPNDVGRYLREFLMDKWVIDIAKPLRWFLVNVLVIPKRKYASGEAYKTIWGPRGSPLLNHLRDLAEKVRPLATDFTHVEIAMRYGNPSIEKAIRAFRDGGVQELVVFPLYPQYAESSTRSSIEECKRIAATVAPTMKLEFVRDFYEHPAFIRAYAEEVRKTFGDRMPDRLLLSFHGLPERHVKRTDASGSHCLQKKDCCAQIVAANRECYRAQCFATTRALARELGLASEKVIVSFQSRLGRTPWIQPFTDVVIPGLPSGGVKSLVVACHLVV